MTPARTKKITNQLNVLNKTLYLFAASTLILFPATIVVAENLGGSFALAAVLIGLIILVAHRKPILPVTPEERWLFVSVTLLFISAVATSIYNNTDLARADRFPNFIMIIPLYAFFRLCAVDQKYLWQGLVAGSFTTLLCALYQVFWLDMPRAEGSGNAIMFGNTGLIIGTMALAGVGWFRQQQHWMVVLPILAFSCGIAASLLSQSRGGWISLPFLGIALVWYANRHISMKAIASLLCLGLAFTAAIYMIPQTGVQARVENSLLDITAYFNGQYSADPTTISSTSVRFEMWKAAWLIFLDNPILGVGWGNYAVETKALIEQGIIHPEVSGFYHAHNQFLSALAKGGLLGLLALAALLFYPLAILLKYTRVKYQPEVTRIALAGSIFVLGCILFCLTEAILEKSRTIIIFGFYIAVCMALIRNQVERNEE